MGKSPVATAISPAMPAGETPLKGTATPATVPSWRTPRALSPLTTPGANASASLAAIISGQAWRFGKPGSGSVLAMIAASACIETLLLKVGGNGNVQSLLRPNMDPHWEIPAVQMELSPYAICPCVTMESRPQMLAVPFSKLWRGSSAVLNLFMDGSARAIFYSYQKLLTDGIGEYYAKRVELQAPWDSVYDSIPWPSPDEIVASIPEITWERLCIECPKFGIIAAA